MGAFFHLWGLGNGLSCQIYRAGTNTLASSLCHHPICPSLIFSKYFMQHKYSKKKKKCYFTKRPQAAVYLAQTLELWTLQIYDQTLILINFDWVWSQFDRKSKHLIKLKVVPYLRLWNSLHYNHVQEFV